MPSGPFALEGMKGTTCLSVAVAIVFDPFG